MDSANVEQSRVWKEARRLRALELVQKGWKQTDVAEALGVTRGAVSQWVAKAREGGIQALRRRKAPGGRPKLSGAQLARLPELLVCGPAAFGFSGEVWTCRRVGQVIRQEFGVSYDPSQVGRILKGCGWSRQKPVRRASQRDEEAIRNWRNERFPQLKKRPWPKAGPSCGPTNRVSTCCPRCCIPGRRWPGRRQSATS